MLNHHLMTDNDHFVIKSATPGSGDQRLGAACLLIRGDSGMQAENIMNSSSER